MKLLIITQKVSKNDTILGFVHRWIVEFSKTFDSIVVICLEKGEYDLPGNVKVLSLGKEERQSRIQYLIHFYWYIQHERKNYDAVLVHMNEEYAFLAGWLWRLWGKKVAMWRNHPSGSIFTDIAAMFCNKVFCTSKYSYTAKYKKTTLMPVGIDTDIFKPSNVKKTPHSILFLARIAPFKRPDIFIDSLNILKNKGVKFTASIYGDPLPKDVEYYESLKVKASEFGLNGNLSFCAGIPNEQTPSIYSAYDIFVNLSPSGMYDKTIFEAMACGCLSLSSNKNLTGIVSPALLFEEANKEDLASKLEALIKISETEKEANRLNSLQLTRSRHSLSALAEMLRDSIQTIK